VLEILSLVKELLVLDTSAERDAVVLVCLFNELESNLMSDDLEFLTTDERGEVLMA